MKKERRGKRRKTENRKGKKRKAKKRNELKKDSRMQARENWPKLTQTGQRREALVKVNRKKLGKRGSASMTRIKREKERSGSELGERKKTVNHEKTKNRKVREDHKARQREKKFQNLRSSFVTSFSVNDKAAKKRPVTQEITQILTGRTTTTVATTKTGAKRPVT